MTTTASSNTRGEATVDPADATRAAMAVTVHVRYFAGARAAAGVPAEDIALPGAGPTTVNDVVHEITHRHGAALQRVLAASGFLLDGITVHERTSIVSDGAELDVLPPFAGG